MAKLVLTDVGIWIEGDSYAGVSNSVGVDTTADAPESTNFESGKWRDYEEGGLKVSSLSLGGFFDAEETDKQQFESLGKERSVLIVPDGKNPGDVARVVPVVASAHGISGSIGDLVGFAYAAQGDGRPLRAFVMDIRSGIDSDVDQARQDFGAIPVGHVQKVFLHVKRRSGTLRVDLMSAAAMAGGTVTQRVQTLNIVETGIYELVVQSGALNPVNDEYWFLRYDVSGANPDFDVAAASIYGQHQTIIPSPPITPVTPPGTVSLRGGTSADDTAQASELTITGANHILTFAPFTNRHLLIARRASQGDITSVVLSNDPTMQNQIGGFTKQGAQVTVGGVSYNVWVSNQSLTFTAQTDVEAQ